MYHVLEGWLAEAKLSYHGETIVPRINSVYAVGNQQRWFVPSNSKEHLSSLRSSHHLSRAFHGLMDGPFFHATMRENSRICYIPLGQVLEQLRGRMWLISFPIASQWSEGSTSHGQ